MIAGRCRQRSATTPVRVDGLLLGSALDRGRPKWPYEPFRCPAILTPASAPNGLSSFVLVPVSGSSVCERLEDSVDRTISLSLAVVGSQAMVKTASSPAACRRSSNHVGNAKHRAQTDAVAVITGSAR